MKLDGSGVATPGSNWTTDFVVVGGNASLLGSPATYSSTEHSVGRVAVATSTATASPTWPWPTRWADSVAILLNNGNGTFSAPTLFTGTTFDEPYALAVGDFNGDGKLDLAVANFGSNRIRIFDGAGQRHFFLRRQALNRQRTDCPGGGGFQRRRKTGPGRGKLPQTTRSRSS